MPALTTDGYCSSSAFSRSAHSSFDGSRKSHDKTLGGVFTYTNGTDVDTGLPDHRLDQLKTLKNNSLSSLANGVNPPNGSLKGLPLSDRQRSHSKSGSIQSIGSAGGREYDAAPGGGRQYSTDGLTKLSTVENASDHVNGRLPQPRRPAELARLRTSSSHGSFASPEHEQITQMAPTAHDLATTTDPLKLSPQAPQLPSLNRFSSPPGTSPGALGHEHRPDGSAELPKLAQRHTLQVPKAASMERGSRDFSFATEPSEEVISATGRFSPTHDTFRHRRASLGLGRRTTRSVQSDAHLDEVIPDEDALRWTEAIRQKRASRRKRREDEDDDRVIVGKKVEEGHVNWVIAYNMLTGIRFTVSRTNAKMDRELTDADFTARHKFSFDITGNELTPSAKYDFKFKDYSPWVFRHLRAIFGLDPADYLMSLTSKYILSELGSPGKSGSFFYFSRDYKYIIKTIHHAEHKLLRTVLRDYYDHVVANPNTLISQFYGLHRVKIPYGRKIHFVVMNNLFPPHRDIHQMFDLKGSTVGRDYREQDLALNPRATMKDLNWLRRDLHLEFDKRIKQIFLEQLQRDVALLQKLHIMDYSLLVGMHDLDKGNDENLREATLKVFQPGGERSGGTSDEKHNFLLRTPSRLENARKARELRLTLKKEKPVPMGQLPISAKMPDEMDSGDLRRDRIFYGDDGGIRATHEDGQKADEIYYLGVIDCLTHYGFLKRVEHYWKGLSSARTQISPIPPHAYGERFLNFISGITMTKEEAERKKAGEKETVPAVVNSDITQAEASQMVPMSSVDGAPLTPMEREKTRRSSTNQPLAGSGSSSSPPQSPNTSSVEKTMRKAHKQLGKEDKANERHKRKSGEEEVPDRFVTTMETKDRTTLPVIGEVGETSNGNSTTTSRGKSPGGIRQVSRSTAGEGDQLTNDGHDVDSVDANGDEHDESARRADADESRNSFFASPRALEPHQSVVDTEGRPLGNGRISPGPSLGAGGRSIT